MTAFLSKLGLEQCVQAVVHNGFYTSMEALRGATYEELVDSGVRPGHAKLILGHLNSSGGLSASLGPIAEAAGAAGGAAEVAAFLRSVGLEACEGALSEAGYASVEALGRATLKELVAVGIKPVHARLIVSNLDSASSLAGATPAGRRNGSFDEESLLGGPRKRRTPTRLYALAAFGVLLLLGAPPGWAKPAACLSWLCGWAVGWVVWRGPPVCRGSVWCGCIRWSGLGVSSEGPPERWRATPPLPTSATNHRPPRPPPRRRLHAPRLGWGEAEPSGRRRTGRRRTRAGRRRHRRRRRRRRRLSHAQAGQEWWGEPRAACQGQGRWERRRRRRSRARVTTSKPRGARTPGG